MIAPLTQTAAEDVSETDLPETGEADLIRLSDPDITRAELDAVYAVLSGTDLSSGKIVEAFEAEFAASLGRKYAIAVASGSLGLLLALKARGIGPGDEVIASPFGFREAQHAIAHAGATPVFADIDYWSGTLAPAKVEAKLTDKTRAILAANTNGHPAPWSELKALADAHGLALLEDSCEAIGSRYQGALVGSFGDCAVFDFAQPLALACGEGGMIVTDDVDLAVLIRRMRARGLAERTSAVAGNTPALQAGMSNLTAALGLCQLRRLDEILAKRKRIQEIYDTQMQTFEGIKPPYVAPDVSEVHWFLYLVHLGTRFSKSSRDAMVDDLRVEEVEAAAFASPLHLQRHYREQGYKKGDFFVTEKVADRAIALPFHTHLDQSQIAFLVETMKDASINVGAGGAIY